MQVAGLHRADPSVTLYKVNFIVLIILLNSCRFVNSRRRFCTVVQKLWNSVPLEGVVSYALITPAKISSTRMNVTARSAEMQTIRIVFVFLFSPSLDSRSGSSRDLRSAVTTAL